MKKILIAELQRALQDCVARGLIPETELPIIEVGLPREAGRGDYATNCALVMASRLKMPPRRLAGNLAAHGGAPALEQIAVAGPGFINFFIRDDVWRRLRREVDSLAEHYGENELGGGRRVQVEFVSANPTGPLHVGHARGAVVGDVMANLLAASHYAVVREYYINDAGNQMHNLGR